MSFPYKNKRKALDDSLSSQKKKFKSSASNSKKESELFDLFTRKTITGDGNCLYRAILYSLFGDDREYESFRGVICDYMTIHRNEFESFVVTEEESFDQYIQRKRLDGEWGDEPELIAASQLLQFNFQVYNCNSLSIRYQYHYTSKFSTIYLEFYNENHYNSLISKEQNKVTINLRKPSKHKAEKSINQSYIQRLTNNQYNLKYDTADVFKALKKDQKLTKLEKNHVKDKEQESLVNLSNKEFQGLYRKAKNNNNTYNEAFRYLKYKIKPQRFKLEKDFQNWKNNIEKAYYISMHPQSQQSESTLVLMSRNGDHVTIPFHSEIPFIIKNAHNNLTKLKLSLKSEY